MTSFFSLSSVLLAVVLAFLSWLALHLVVYKLWLGPLRTQRMMGAQGIIGPPYKFLYGTTKQILRFIKESPQSSSPGPTHHVFSQLQPHIHTWINTYGSVYLNWVGHEAELVVTEPELIKEILKNKDGAFKKIQPKGIRKKIFGDGLVTTEAGKWSKLRKLAHRAFHGEILKDSVPEVVDAVHAMLQRLKQSEGKEIEIFGELKTAASEVISRTAFGSSYAEGENIFKMIQQLTQFISRENHKIRLPGISKIWKTGDEVEQDKLERGIHDLILGIINKREEEVVVAKAKGEISYGLGNDYLGLLVNAWKEEDESKRITLDDLVDECKTFYLAGQGTIRSLLSWIIFLLAIHPDWQVEARNEVVSIFGQQGQPNNQGLAKLKTMTMIINETLRLYPPIISITRKTERPVKLGSSIVLPANMRIFIPNLKLQYDPQFWGDDVHLFKPERFADGIAKVTSMAMFLPFGIGPRYCIGANFAMTEAKVVLSMILQHYSFALSPTYVHKQNRLSPILLAPMHGIHVIFHPLHNME